MPSHASCARSKTPMHNSAIARNRSARRSQVRDCKFSLGSLHRFLLVSIYVSLKDVADLTTFPHGREIRMGFRPLGEALEAAKCSVKPVGMEVIGTPVKDSSRISLGQASQGLNRLSSKDQAVWGSTMVLR